jgi:hypothetical protein
MADTTHHDAAGYGNKMLSFLILIHEILIFVCMISVRIERTHQEHERGIHTQERDGSCLKPRMGANWPGRAKCSVETEGECWRNAECDWETDQVW